MKQDSWENRVTRANYQAIREHGTPGINEKLEAMLKEMAESDDSSRKRERRTLVVSICTLIVAAFTLIVCVIGYWHQIAEFFRRLRF